MDDNSNTTTSLSSPGHIYVAIDLKSFYASVECVLRNLDPLTTNLVVADESRTEKTICLAVSPSLKKYGIPGRARLFEVIAKVNAVNKERLSHMSSDHFNGTTYDDLVLAKHPDFEVGYIVAPPQMAVYLEYSTKIYDIYLRYIAPEDIHVYSIDEVFLDVTQYLKIYKMDARTLTSTIIREILTETGITATAGIGTNLYLCKIAMDIMAKHARKDQHGVRIACLDEESYRRNLWTHRPLTDFWRVGRGYAKKLESMGLYTMGDIARCSLGGPQDYYNEDLLYKAFGVNAELLIDHAWGYEPVTIADVKAYQPKENSICFGQVLSHPYSFDKARLVLWEMADALSLDLVQKKRLTDQLVLTVGYDIENLSSPVLNDKIKEISTDAYGRNVPKPAHGTTTLKTQTASSKLIIDAVLTLYDKIVDKHLYIRRLTLTANRVVEEGSDYDQRAYEQMDLLSFLSPSSGDSEKEASSSGKSKEISEEFLAKERKLQEAMLKVKKRYGKNAILKGTNLEDGATMKERNSQIGGHKA